MWLRHVHLTLSRFNIPTNMYKKKHAMLARNISDEVDLDRELKVFLLDEEWCMGVVSFSATNGNTQYLYPNFSFTITQLYSVIEM